MESFVINNTEWITSVWWQDIKANSKKGIHRKARFHYRKNAQRAYDAYCVIESNGSYQAGYVERDPNLPIANQKALAALFVAKHKDCAIRLVFESGVWVCAISDGLIEPDTDFFGTEEEADRVFNDFFSLRDWEKIIEGRDPGASTELIQTLSTEIVKVANLRPVTRNISKQQAFIAGCTVVVIVIALILGKTYLDRKEVARKAEEAAKRARVLKQLDEKNYQDQIEKLQFKRVWESEPSVRGGVDFCYSEMKTFPLVEKGWFLDTLTCTQTNVEAKWKRLAYARFTDLPANAEFDVNDPAAKQAVSNWQRKAEIPIRKTGIHLLKKGDGAANLYQLARDYQFAVSATWVKPEIRTIPARNPNEKPKTIVSPYSKCLWELTGKHRPEDKMIDILSGLPGMMLKEVIHIYEKGQWIIKGEFYVL